MVSGFYFGNCNGGGNHVGIRARNGATASAEMKRANAAPEMRRKLFNAVSLSSITVFSTLICILELSKDFLLKAQNTKLQLDKSQMTAIIEYRVVIKSKALKTSLNASLY